MAVGGLAGLRKARLAVAAVSLDVICLRLTLILPFGWAEQKPLGPHAGWVKMRSKC